MLTVQPASGCSGRWLTRAPMRRSGDLDEMSGEVGSAEGGHVAVATEADVAGRCRRWRQLLFDACLT